MNSIPKEKKIPIIAEIAEDSWRLTTEQLDEYIDLDDPELLKQAEVL